MTVEPFCCVMFALAKPPLRIDEMNATSYIRKHENSHTEAIGLKNDISLSYAMEIHCAWPTSLITKKRKGWVQSRILFIWLSFACFQCMQTKECCLFLIIRACWHHLIARYFPFVEDLSWNERVVDGGETIHGVLAWRAYNNPIFQMVLSRQNSVCVILKRCH